MRGGGGNPRREEALPRHTRGRRGDWKLLKKSRSRRKMKTDREREEKSIVLPASLVLPRCLLPFFPFKAAPFPDSTVYSTPVNCLAKR